VVRIYEDPKSSEVVVWTSCLTMETFLQELPVALAALQSKDRELALSEALKHAFPIAFKLSGYKADDVQEQRTLYHGTISPAHCKVLSEGGKE
jgi:hypothetical protein